MITVKRSFSYLLRDVQAAELPLFGEHRPDEFGYFGYLSGRFQPDGKFQYKQSKSILRMPELSAVIRQFVAYFQNDGIPPLFKNYIELRDYCYACPEAQMFEDSPYDWGFTTCSEKYHFFIRVRLGLSSDSTVIGVYIYDRVMLARADLETVPLNFT